MTIGAILELKAARDRLGACDQPEVDAALQRVRAVLGQVDGEIKRIIHDLRPPSLDALVLPAAIGRSIEHFQSFSGLLCRMRVRGRPRRLPPDAEIGIYRVMQEALQNAAAHARASRSVVRLTFHPRGVDLEVEDNGQGFEPLAPPAQAEGHLGLAGMRERAENLGGSLHIESGLGNGTRVRLSVPATRGDRLISPSLLNHVLQQFAESRRGQARPESGLSAEDIRVLALIASGAGNEEIALALNWSMASVKRKLQHIFASLGVSSRAQAAAEAVRRGLA